MMRNVVDARWQCIGFGAAALLIPLLVTSRATKTIWLLPTAAGPSEHRLPDSPLKMSVILAISTHELSALRTCSHHGPHLLWSIAEGAANDLPAAKNTSLAD